MENKKGKSRRSQVAYPALKPHYNLKIRYDELADIDYLDKLNDSEKKFLNEFMEGWVNANPKGTMFENKKELYRRNNSRNACVYSRAKARGGLVYFSNISKRDEGKTYEEEKMIARVDVTKKEK